MQSPSATDTRRRLPRRAAGRIGARALSSVAFGATLALIARMTTLDQFGVFMLAYSVGLVVGTLSGLGAPSRVLRAGADREAAPGALFVVFAVMVGGASALCGIVYGAIAPHWAVYAGLLLALGDTFVNFAVAHMTAADRHVVANLLVLGHRLIPFAAVALFYGFGPSMHFPAFSAVLLVPALVALVVPAVLVSIPESLRQWRSAFAGGAGFWAYSMSALIGQLQVPVLAAVTSASVVATYSLAAKVVGPISILTASVSVVVVPELVRRLAQQARFDRLFNSIIGLSLAYLVIVSVLAWPLADLIGHVVGPQYRAAEPIVIGMAIGAGISGCSQALGARLLALGHPLSASMAILAGGLVGLALLGSVGMLDLVGELWLVPLIVEIVVVAAMVMANRTCSAPLRLDGRRRRSAA
jgi:O-antigen/teichoic acid export membrane protein